MAQRLDPLTHLERSDKWYLGGGNNSCFAPPFPLYLKTLGFWDEGHFAEVPLPRLFTIFVLNEAGEPLPLQSSSMSWRPDRLRQSFDCATDSDLVVREEKVVLAEDIFASHLTCANRSEEPRNLDILVWTIREKQAAAGPHPTLKGDMRLDDGKLRWIETLVTPEGREETLHYCLGANQELVSSSLNLTEPTCRQPLWQVSTLPEKFHNGRLAEDHKLDVGAVPHGEVHAALHYRLTIPPHERRDLTVACTVAAAHECACQIHETSLQVDVVATAVSQWRQYFESVPYFSCSDPFLTRYYWYRWFGLRLSMVDPQMGYLQHPCVFEGIGQFRWFISYSAQCHMLECSWMHDPAVAKGALLAALDNQMETGQLRGHTGLFSRDEGFYHADWAGPALQILALHPDPQFAQAVYEPLARYAAYFDRERDREASGLYDVINQGETGQEYMPRYMAVHPEADRWVKLQLKGVDASVYVYQLKRALAALAEQLGKPEDAGRWREQAAKTGEAILQHMWDAADGMFYDCDPKTLQPTRCKAAVCFYPFLTDLCGPEHLAALRRHLLNPQEFWLPSGPPSTSADDDLYSSHGEWKGKRMPCPWNGRMWPMTTSHLCEALARAAREHDATLRPQAAELIRRFIHTMFFGKDALRPNCFEHYNPVTGEPSAYRGIDDYQHSWVVDLIIKHVAGLQPVDGDTLVVDPLDFNLQDFSLRDVRYRGHRVDIMYGEVQADRPPLLQVKVDGELKAEREGLGRLEVSLAD